MNRRTFLRSTLSGVTALAVPSFALVSLAQRETALRVDWGQISPSELSFHYDRSTGWLTVVNLAQSTREVRGAVMFGERGSSQLILCDEHGEPVPELRYAEAVSTVGLEATGLRI